MAVREIRLLGDPILRQRAAPVTEVNREVRELITDLWETMGEAAGIGLAAPQIGVSRRVVVVDTQEDPRLALVNPEILDRRGWAKVEEGCLSIPGVSAEVERAARIRFRALDEEGRSLEEEATGLLARVIEHELDHLDGILFTDRLGPLQREIVLKEYRRLQEEGGEAAVGRAVSL